MGEQKAPLRGKTFGARLKEAYERNGWNRSEFQRRLQQADRALSKLASTTVYTWELDQKRPRMAALSVIARVTGFSIDQLLSDPVKPEPESSGVLTKHEVVDLLERLGSSPELVSKVLHEFEEHPPKGGVTHETVVHARRLLLLGATLPAKVEHPINAELRQEAMRLGMKPVDAETLRNDVRDVVRESSKSANDPRAKPRRRRDA